MQVSPEASGTESNRRMQRINVLSRKIYRLCRKKVSKVVKKQPPILSSQSTFEYQKAGPSSAYFW